MQVGAVEDREQQEPLASLVQLYSSHSKGSLTSFDDYIKRVEERNEKIAEGSSSDLPKGASVQGNVIYYLVADSLKSAEDAPSLEMPKKKGFEVLLGVDPLDEFFLASIALNGYKGWQLIDVNKADAHFGDGTKVGGPNGNSIEPSSLDTKRIELGG